MGFRHDVRASLAVLAERVQRLDAAIVVRDPGNARSVEAYEGLRRSVVNAVRARRQQLSQLVVLSEALDRGASLDDLQALAEQWRMEAGIETSTDATHPDHFEIIEGSGEVIEVLTAAWLDVAAGDHPVLFKRGTARRVAAPEPAEPSMASSGQPEKDPPAAATADHETSATRPPVADAEPQTPPGATPPGGDGVDGSEQPPDSAPSVASEDLEAQGGGER